MGKSQILVMNRVRVLGSGPHTPIQFFESTPGYVGKLINFVWLLLLQQIKVLNVDKSAKVCVKFADVSGIGPSLLECPPLRGAIASLFKIVC